MGALSLCVLHCNQACSNFAQRNDRRIVGAKRKNGESSLTKALLSRDPGGPETLKLEEVPDPVAKPGEVVVAIKACGVNFPDVLTI